MHANDQSDWWPQDPNSVTQAYIDAHFEFNPDFIESDRPYNGVHWNTMFKSIPGTDAWKLRRDHIMNDLTADLIATVELLDLPHTMKIDSGMPGGLHAEGLDVWMPLLDGGLWVEFSQYQHAETNSLSAYQRTYVRGAMTLRYLLFSLGFDGPKGRLKGEKNIPLHRDIMDLLEKQKCLETPENASLISSVKNIHSETSTLRELHNVY